MEPLLTNGQKAISLDATDDLVYAPKDSALIVRLNKNLTNGSTRTMKISVKNCSQYGSGSLLKAYDALSGVLGQDDCDVEQVLYLQAAVANELESRGWTLNDDDEYCYFLEEQT